MLNHKKEIERLRRLPSCLRSMELRKYNRYQLIEILRHLGSEPSTLFALMTPVESLTLKVFNHL